MDFVHKHIAAYIIRTVIMMEICYMQYLMYPERVLKVLGRRKGKGINEKIGPTM